MPDRVGLHGGSESVPIRTDWPIALNQTLRVALHLIGPEVLRVVVHRALTHARPPTLSETALAPLITSDGLVKAGSLLGAALDAHAVPVLIASLTQQMGRLLGAEASRPFREELAVVFPGLSELPAN